MIWKTNPPHLKIQGERRAGAAGRAGIGGFTLIELMIVVGVIAILAAIAIPNYNDAVRKGRRGQAKADLTELAQIMERFRTINGTYQIVTNPITQSPKTGTTFYYRIDIASKSNTEFKLTATPLATGGQNKDSCGVLSIDQLGAKKHSTGDDAQCSFGTTGT